MMDQGNFRHQKECIMMVATRRENEEYFLRDDFECDYYEKRKNCNESGKCVDEVKFYIRKRTYNMDICDN